MSESDVLRSTRAAYDLVAADYAARAGTELAGKPLDRAMFAAFAELIRDGGNGPVADLGCGPGHVTAHLHSLGLAVFGIDLSPGMVALARRQYPRLRFDVGTMTGLDLADSALGGLVARYSLAHTPPDRLPEIFAEFRRVLAPGGHALLVFQAGDERRHLTRALGHPVSIDSFYFPPDRIVELLGRAGLGVAARLVREPAPTDPTERVRQVCLLARRPA